jgi:hypothetical protein
MKKHQLILLFLFGQISCSVSQDKEESKTIEHTYTNELINESSPYLLQHAHNPVNWYPWGEEALQKAKDENKPIIISIGYAACHWCHVMEKESFEDSATAKFMNEKFICIKVDREERPDIDQIYMNAAQLLTGRGGWPLNAFALPDGKPFYAGTYFPTDQWNNLLVQIDEAYTQNLSQLKEQANQLTEGIKADEIIKTPFNSEVKIKKTQYNALFNNWKATLDMKKGGFDRAPKFPLPIGWEFLLQQYYLTQNEEALEAVNITLTEMAKGGIYDQIGGGFARYSTDENWFAPHFEKMLYDNGQLVSLYANAYKITKNPLYAEVIEETLAFTERELSNGKGGFFSSLNADSEGIEGKFYVWKSTEINNLLGKKDGEIINDYYNTKVNGNWESGENILFRNQSRLEFVTKNQLDADQFEQFLSDSKSTLLKERAKRVRPSTDDKTLTAWNALMLKAYVDAYTALNNKDYLKTAIKNANFLEQNMLQKDGSLLRNYKDEKASIPAFLDDYALLAEAYISLYQATFDIKWLNLSKQITAYTVAHFKDDTSGMFFYTSNKAETLIARKMEISDNVIPSSNSVFAKVLYQLGVYYELTEYIDMSKAMLNQVSEKVSTGGPYYANWAQLMGMVTYGTYEVAIMGDNAYATNISVQSNYLPTALFMGGEKENLPLLDQKLMEERTMIYVCRNRVCELPVEHVDKALSQIK